MAMPTCSTLLDFGTSLNSRAWEAMLGLPFDGGNITSLIGLNESFRVEVWSESTAWRWRPSMEVTRLNDILTEFGLTISDPVQPKSKSKCRQLFVFVRGQPVGFVLWYAFAKACGVVGRKWRAGRFLETRSVKMVWSCDRWVVAKSELSKSYVSVRCQRGLWMVYM